LNRFLRTLTICLLAIASAAGFGLVTSCNIIGGGAPGGTGGLNVLVTDGPTDDWQEVTIVLKSISLHNLGTNSWAEVWMADTANPAAGTVNLVDLSGVATILKSATIPVGTYNRLKLVIDTDPTTMKLVTDGGATIDPANITVVDPSGKGEIKVDLDPDITVEEGKDAVVLVDFDLSHPLSIVNLDGKVVISLKVRHRPLPHRLQSLQFARTIGDIKAVAADLTTITITNLQEADVVFKVNANTTYIDADKSAAGTLEGMKALVGTGAALVASTMLADGSLYARCVWYAAAIETLPRFTPEGLVRRVGDNWLSIMKKRTEELPTGDHHRQCDWDSQTVFVDDKTIWTFQQDVDMGTGASVLRYIARGFRVEVEYVDAAASPLVAKSINVHSAHAEGLVTAATAENFTFGWRDHTRTMVYSTIADHTFGWLFYGTVDASRSTVVQDFVDAVAQARTARLWIFAHAGLTWDAANTRWVVENLVIAPLMLHDLTKITTNYTAASGTMGVSTYDCWDWTTPVEMTVALDQTGDLQTVVGSFVWNGQTNVVTFTLPVLPSEWEALLTTAVNRAKIWVYPVKKDTTWSWHAYTVIAYQFIR
jgi:hypothetical protein